MEYNIVYLTINNSLMSIQVQSLILAPINLQMLQLIVGFKKWMQPSMLVKPMKIVKFIFTTLHVLGTVILIMLCSNDLMILIAVNDQIDDPYGIFEPTLHQSSLDGTITYIVMYTSNYSPSQLCLINILSPRLLGDHATRRSCIP
jgi:hypothetical protein